MKFYKLQDEGKSSFDYAEGNDWEGITCPIDEGHQRAGKRITILAVEQTRKKIVDFSWTILSDIIISNRVLEQLEKEKIRGFKVHPLQILNYDIANENMFWELEITGNGGKAHKSSGIKTIKKCDSCGFVQYSPFENGLIVDKESWDKSSIFTIQEYPKFILVTEDLKNILERSKFSNIEFVESCELKIK